MRLHALIRGAVQGVGFRPFIHRIAAELGLAGYVLNTPAGVVIEAEGPRGALDVFLSRLEPDRPPLSIIESVEVRWIEPAGARGFDIRQSDTEGDVSALILPDIATCPECLREIFDPRNRRYRYPFTNCTHCGPRFSIIECLPYDRPNTSMKGFILCETCRAEYEDPGNRRFHAQPTACPACGPRLTLWDATGRPESTGEDALLAAADAIRSGQVVAVKGLGGFHLVVDARNDEAIRRLRRHKHREEKPFALMYPSLENIREDCVVEPLAERLLQSPESPIVLLERISERCGVAEAVAPGAPSLGVMLPYTPLHHLLMTELRFSIVATSGNLSEEPICIDEHEALERLGGIADCFLVHDRPIVRHVDDSIVRIVRGREMVLRRARGYAPLPIRVAEDGPIVAAVGGHLKNTVAVAKQGNVYLGQHIGDLATVRALDAFTEALAALQSLYEAPPELVVCDMHPDYLSTQYAHDLGCLVRAVQHHHAHVLACMAEHRLEGPVLGVAWDGTGFGPDGTIWGGEFLWTTFKEYRRIGRLRPFSLPGGDKAVSEPRRSAVAILYAVFGPETFERFDVPSIRAFGKGELRTVMQMLVRKVNSPSTSSVGRLFDAVASLLDLRQRSSFEGQAAMALEYAARRGRGQAVLLPLPLRPSEVGWELDWAPMIEAILCEYNSGAALAAIAAGFHDALAHGILQTALRAGLEHVVLTGGCFQNVMLTEITVGLLRNAGFTVHWHHRVPPNDGGIALGQAAFAIRREMQNVSGDSR